jgi:hypothetical protein
MSHNPYTPPTAHVDDLAGSASAAGASGPLYSPRQLAIAAFLGSPLAAAWFAAANFKALAQPIKARQTLYWGVGLLVVVTIVSFLLPDGVPNSVLPIAYSIGVYTAAKQRFEETVRLHLAAGGKLGSWWRVVGVSLLVSLVLVVVLVAVVFAVASTQPSSV